MNEIKSSDVFSQLRAIGEAAKQQQSRATRPQSSEFSQLVKETIETVNDRQQNAVALAEAFERGDNNVDLTRVMVEMQKARVSFEAAYQVRNKLIEAYREVMNMQV